MGRGEGRSEGGNWNDVSQGEQCFVSFSRGVPAQNHGIFRGRGLRPLHRRRREGVFRLPESQPLQGHHLRTDLKVTVLEFEFLV